MVIYLGPICAEVHAEYMGKCVWVEHLVLVTESACTVAYAIYVMHLLDYFITIHFVLFCFVFFINCY